MSPHVLRRCDVCGRYHASYIVPDEARGGKAYYCYDCWKAKFGGMPSPASDQEEEHPGDQVKPNQTDDPKS